ncbi:MAG: bifunctional hydroxymethylpyrimidine kinase/phosphomethylpyrimidine kinase [Acidobacteriaceae bacterium]
MAFPLAKVPPRGTGTPLVLLSIAGFDPSGGAGILADLKTFAALGSYGMACITAMTIQSTQGVRHVFGVDARIVRETLDCLATDASFACIKVGMLGSGEIAGVVLDWLNTKKEVPVVLDPVVKSSSGKDLQDSAGREMLATRWLGRAQWITPNFAELADLTGCGAVSGRTDVEAAATKLLQLATGQGNPGLKIVATGGEAEKPEDLLLTERELRWFTGERIVTTSTHGTGCAFSSALAARIAMGDPDSAAVQAAKDYVTGALRHAYPVGRGNGPLHHFWERPVR